MKVTAQFEFVGELGHEPQSKTEWAAWIDSVLAKGGLIQASVGWKILYEETDDERN